MRLIGVNLSAPKLRHCGLHRHGCWELVVFVNGEGIHRVGDVQIPFQPGTIVCQPPHVPHGTDSEDGWQDMYLQIEDYSPPDGRAVPVFQDDGERQFTHLARFCLNAFHLPGAQNAALAHSLMEAAHSLLACWGEAQSRDALVEGFLQRLIQGVSDPHLDISDLIRQTGYCPDAFRRRFKAATGATPTAYLISQRIAHARALLESTTGGMSIRQVAAQCGFDDPYYFSTLFRRRTGVSPSQFRQSINRHEEETL